MSTIDSTPISQLYNPNQHQHQPQQQQQQRNGGGGGVMSSNAQNMFPSRDIPQNTIQFTNDDEIKNNHIPQPSHNQEYIYNHPEENLHDYENRRYKKDILTDFLYYQDYIFLICLYVFFQLPVVNDIIKINFHALGMCNIDGNMNIKCHAIKGFLLTVLYRFCITLFSSYT